MVVVGSASVDHSRKGLAEGPVLSDSIPAQAAELRWIGQGQRDRGV